MSGLRRLLIAVIFGVPTTAHAICFQGGGYDFAAQVNSTVDWLVCLHNEQNDAINAQANALSDLTRTVNTNANIFNDQKDTIARLQFQVDSAEPLVAEMQRMIGELIAENKALTERVEALESNR